MYVCMYVCMYVYVCSVSPPAVRLGVPVVNLPDSRAVNLPDNRSGNRPDSPVGNLTWSRRRPSRDNAIHLAVPVRNLTC